MQKLSGTSSGKNNKSCRIFYNESNNNWVCIFLIFYDFLWILQDSAKHKHYWSYNFAISPLGFLSVHNCTLILRLSPQKVFSPCNVAPVGGGRRGWWNSGKVRRRGRPGTGVGWSRGALGPISTFGWRGGSAGGVARRR
jgi:hypothetical protein